MKTALRTALADDLNRLLEAGPIYEADRFAQVKISDYLQQFIAQNPQGDTRVRLNRLLLEAAYPEDIAKSLGGVYPDREIYIPSPEDSQRCFLDYMEDVQRRMQTGQMMPGEDALLIQWPNAGQRPGRRDDDQRLSLQSHFRSQSNQRIFHRGKLPAALDVSL